MVFYFAMTSSNKLDFSIKMIIVGMIIAKTVVDYYLVSGKYHSAEQHI